MFVAMAIGSVTVTALEDIPLVRPGDDVAALLISAIERLGCVLGKHDVLVIAQKIVSKAEGRYVDLALVSPSAEALDIGRQTQKDPRFIEVILRESQRVVRHRPNVVIVEHKLGFVMANAGIDRSNVDPSAGIEPVLLLPRDPDKSCAALRARIGSAFGTAPGVIISDSFGRAWRRGTAGVAIGAAGLPALTDMRGHPDLFGRELQVTQIGFADEIASAASLLMGQADEAVPAVLVQGLTWSAPDTPGADLIRPASEDLFR
jgi:coenzyme F420-0:L-glutamate ligase/coenzyme F420-1:gamma-L-glutamate ligase